MQIQCSNYRRWTAPDVTDVSVNFNPSKVQRSNGNVFYFEFEQIFLPDSTTNEPESHGFIRYVVKPIAGMANGETIKKTA